VVGGQGHYDRLPGRGRGRGRGRNRMGHALSAARLPVLLRPAHAAILGLRLWLRRGSGESRGHIYDGGEPVVSDR
jgi:hypothetical protein